MKKNEFQVPSSMSTSTMSDVAVLYCAKRNEQREPPQLSCFDIAPYDLVS